MGKCANLLRDFCFRAAKIPALNACAHRSYWIAASAIAERFSALPEISKVSLVRGMVRGIVPALSDIDLQLSHDEPHGPPTVTLLLKLRQRHKMLKRIFPMLGELGISCQSEQASRVEKSTIALIDSRERLTYARGTWAAENIPVSRPFRKLEKISLFLKHFIFTSRLPEAGAPPGSLAHARIIRYLEKMNRLVQSDGSPAPLDFKSPLPQLFAESYLNLHNLAVEALEEEPWYKKEVDLQVPIPPHEALDVASAIFLERFLADHQIEAEITATPVPFIFSVASSDQKIAAQTLFGKYFTALSHSRGWRTWGAVFVSHETARCLARTFPMFLQSHYWGWFKLPPGNAYHFETENFLASSLKTLIRLQQPSQPGIFVSLDNDWATSSLVNLMHAAQMLTNHSFSRLPQTAQALRNIRPHHSQIDDHTLAVAIDAVGQEIFDWSETL